LYADGSAGSREHLASLRQGPLIHSSVSV